ncbi:hypothetical protein FIA58_019435 [Flavobacterium jejuense]|uniref:Aromatic ring-opening dioxygenase LigA n=1 Tax=Flavobacterium jejuense TaxID=1544455 RepID=A0ABX0IXG6_9FLAO|nr:hypothetical protein [Flavobacterium jejuense]NHN27856.1 hypothetical protein [Flavobacterium jejuense]
MSGIKLTFINKSEDLNNNIVVFQNNVAEKHDNFAIAWKVIKNSGRLDSHPFTFSNNFEINTSDSYGNFTPRLTTYLGQTYEMVKRNSGDVLQLSKTFASSVNVVEIKNGLAVGVIDASCYKDGNLLATKKGITPGQKASFEFNSKIYIGVASQIEEGSLLNSEMQSKINSEINLIGISSADIVMTGGGTGADATPFEFTLENIKN